MPDLAAAVRRLKLLCDLSRNFSEVIEQEADLFTAIATQIGNATGDGCTVRLLEDDGALLPGVAVFHPQAEYATALRALTSLTSQFADSGIWRGVVGQRKSMRVSVSSQAIPSDASPEQVAFLQRYPACFFMAVPLIARSRVIGGISLVRFEDRPFREDDEAFLQELADRAALSIDNARLLTSERHARQQAERAEEIAVEALAERVRTELELQRTEEMFRQAQKMEAVGRLAGGVAHDFNNVLTVILSYTAMLRDQLRVGEPMRDDIEEIERAGQRAAALTHQLLAFSRQQVLEPRVLDVNDSIRSLEKMLRRILGEDIELTIRLLAGLQRCWFDPGQLQQVLMNLIVNARDAMPRGGKVTIESSNAILDASYVAVHPEAHTGAHVVIAVSDNGAGMDRQTQARIFEPFFTTKAKDHGTGLGLSTVYGIIKQSGGSIWVYSEPGEGTTFKVYIPATADEAFLAPPPTPAVVARGSETILLVEDETQVRLVVGNILRRAGYHVIEASNGGEALLVCEQHGATIQLLLTDVVMPRMSGRDLADRLKPLRPDMSVLFMSGYTEDAVVVHGVLHSGIHFLQKPITPDALLRKVRQVLEGVRE